MIKVEHAISPYVAFGIMPLFAFANAGVSLEGLSIATLLNKVPLGILLGLFIGKQFGVFVFSYISIKLKIAQMPNNSNWFNFYGVGVLTGIGFTMSLFVGNLAFAENMQYNQFVPYTDRLDYLAPLANNVAYACAVEKLMGWELPPRGQAVRVICCELARISAHLLGVGCYAMDVGAMTVFLYTFTQRETVYDLCEQISGARFTTSYTRVGGQTRDISEDTIKGVLKFCDEVSEVIEEVDQLLSRNPIFIGRTQDVGFISKEDAIGYGLTGPNLRGSGVDFDMRKNHPYLSLIHI